MEAKPPAGFQQTAGPQAVYVLVLRTLQTADSVMEVNSSLSSLPALQTPSTSVLFRQTLLSVCLSLLHPTNAIAAIIFRSYCNL
jgi:hypothetical protein